MFHVPNSNRLRKHPTMGSDDSYGNNGVFIVHYPGLAITCIASDGLDWQHVSVTIPETKKCPSWGIMSFVKNIFWDEEDCVIQYHPPKSVYINNHPDCLHLWRPINKEIPIPDTKLIGII